MKRTFALISDTHNIWKEDVPEAEFLLHAGDFTERGKESEIIQAMNWFASLPHEHKVATPGNHDFLFERAEDLARQLTPAGIEMLIGQAKTIGGVKFYGAPYTPTFYNWAFNCEAEQLERHWAHVPEDTDVLISHGPPFGHLDVTARDKNHVGDRALMRAIERVKPRLVVCGHIHEGAGQSEIDWGNGHKTLIVNASVIDERYRIKNQAALITLEL